MEKIKDQITENHKLIAEFMEFETSNAETYTDYSKSWDWLMPVVLRCKERQIFGSQHLINDIANSLRVVEIGYTYIKIIEFIKFYNVYKNEV